MSSPAEPLLLVQFPVKHKAEGNGARVPMNSREEGPLLVQVPVKHRVEGKEGREPMANPPLRP